VIFDNGEPYWNDIGRGKLLVRPPELSGNFTRSHLVAKRDELFKGNYEYGPTEYVLLFFRGIFNMP
jgi:hypothetical protein